MTPSPPRPRREPRRLNPGVAQGSGGLEIRIVPYSPPRISSVSSNAASVSSRPIPGARDDDSASSPLPPASSRHQSYAVEHYIDEDDEPQLGRDAWIRPQLEQAMTSSSKLAATGSYHKHEADDASISSTSRTSSPRPPSSSKRVISLNPDSKTFSLIPLSGSATSRSESLGSSLPQSTTPSGSWGRVSSNAFIIDDRASSPLTPLSERRFSANSGPGPTSITSWDHRMRGGMRRVEGTPDPQGDTRDPVSDSSEPGLPSPLEALPEASSDADMDSSYEAPGSHQQLNTKGSFQSSQTASTLSDRTNYKIYTESSPAPFARQATSDIDDHNYSIYGESSPVVPYTQEAISDIDDSSPLPSIPPSSSHSNYPNPNYEILAASSDIHSLPDDRPPSVDSDANYVVHGGPSASYSSLVTTRSRLQPAYSQESLVVAPLRPVKQRSFERSPTFKTRSRESLRRGSLSSLSSTLSQEATRSLITGSFSPYTQGGIRKQQPWGMATNTMAPQSHQWAAPLSPVMSESEGGSAPPSRSLSAFSLGDRRSSVNSRHVLSISSSMMGLDAHLNAPLEPPAAALSPDPSGSLLQIRDHDEYGDGLADLDSPHQRSSRARLGSFISINGDRPLRSSGSQRSLNMFSFPGWARLYYGGGERRFLIAQPSTDSMRSLYNGSLYNENPPLPPVSQNPRLNRSPSAEQFTTNIRNPRRRPRDGPLSPGQLGPGNDESGDIVPDSIRPPSRVVSIARRMKKQTSSIWSPHLRPDKRASGFSMWDPPEGPWSDDNGFDWKRNRQIVLFVLGFLIPFCKRPLLRASSTSITNTVTFQLGWWPLSYRYPRSQLSP